MNRARHNRWAQYLGLAVIAAGTDLCSKQYVFDRFGVGQGTSWLLDGWLRFRIHTSLNEGALWGIGQGFALAFAVLSCLALVGIWYCLFFRSGSSSRWLTISLGLVSGGILGNLYDRLGVHGLPDPNGEGTWKAVRDFLHFQFGSFDWAIFNFADMCLVTGAIMLMLQSLWIPEPVSAADTV